MEKKRNRYKAMERSVTLILLADLLMFVFYLIAAGNGIVWLKIILFILAMAIAVLCLMFLYRTGEIGKQRSLWMSTAFAAIAVCLLFSLILNYPSPRPQEVVDQNTHQSTTQTESNA